MSDLLRHDGFQWWSAIVLAIVVAGTLAARGCDSIAADWRQERRAEMTCIREHGRWERIDGNKMRCAFDGGAR